MNFDMGQKSSLAFVKVSELDQMGFYIKLKVS